MDSPRVGFVLYLYPLGVSTMVVNSILCFAERGFQVDVFIDAETFNDCPIDFNHSSIHLHLYIRNRWLLLRGLRHLCDRLNSVRPPQDRRAESVPIDAAVFMVMPMLPLFGRWLRRRLRKHQYRFVIAVEHLSLLALNSVSGAHKTIYYNMELMNWDDHNPLYNNKLYWKRLEFRMIDKVDFVAIQSRARGGIFSEINNFPPERILTLPVASMGESAEKKSRYFRDKFPIPDDTKIVIYAGNFMPWAFCREMIQSVRQWPINTVLVMHTWNGFALQTEYFKEMLQDASELPVYFSTDYLAPEELVPAISSGDVGLMFYQPIDSNFTEISCSSNKLGEYLKAGLSIICSDYPSLREFMNTHGVGVAVSSPAEIPEALRKLLPFLDDIRPTVLKCYDKVLRFERFFGDFYARIS